MTELLSTLEQGLGETLLTGEETLGWTTDRSGWIGRGAPAAVVRARDVSDVQLTLRTASQHGVPVVTRGASSGLAGGTAAGEGAIVLDLSRMDRILDLDPAEGTAVVEPGVITAELDAAARQHGLFFAPDPGSVAISTVGGNIATNAGGLRGAKYGVTRDAVLGLEVVLADGRLIRTGRSTVKGVTGYDLTALFVGSEGTLGVVVGATVRLLPVPPETATAAAFFTSIEDAAEAASAVVAAGVRPVTLEIVDGPTLRAIDHVQGSSLASEGDAFLLVQTDGYGAVQELDQAVRAVEPSASLVRVAETPEEAERLVFARRQALPSVEWLGKVLIEDIAVPRRHLAAAIRDTRSIAETHEVDAYIFAHAGDGNIHPLLVYPETPDGSVPPSVQQAADEIFQLALRYGGTITGEHGVGLLKQRWLSEELGQDVHALSRSLRQLFDPSGILNPGKAV